MLVVSMGDRKLMRREADGSLKTHADLAQFTAYLINDMVVDAEGRAYIGNFGMDFPGGKIQSTRLARVDPDGSVHEAVGDLVFPNGMVITPDGKTIVVGETFAGKLTAFAIGAGGALGAGRVWAALPNGAVPDGICLDAEGAIWVASPRTKEVLRVREGGAIAERIATEQMAIACMLGGPDRRTLFVLTSESTDPDECRKKRSARIQAVDVESPGAGLP
jgi:sugar lactone lactonase YvrE